MPVTIPEQYINRGPQPDGVVVTFVASENSVEGVLVTTDTTARTVKRCGVGENPIGWSQGSMVADKEIAIHLVNRMWKADVDSSGGTPVYGDILSVAAAGKVKVADPVSSEVVAGICLAVVENDEQVLLVPITCCPDPIT